MTPSLCCKLGALGVLLGAACAPAEQPGARRSAIINGTLDSGHPAVGLLYSQGEACCTATLIGSRTVLSAAHCLTDDNHAPYAILEPFELELGGKKLSIDAQEIHPSYSGWSVSSDVAVLHLSAPVSGITPALVAATPPAVGEVITLVGFGCSTEGPGPSGFGVKRKGDNSIAEVDPTEFAYPYSSTLASLCDGDSGGPTFATRAGQEVLIGVHSYDIDAFSYDQRVDAFRAWIAQQAGGDLYQGVPAGDAGPTAIDRGLDGTPAGADRGLVEGDARGVEPHTAPDGAPGAEASTRASSAQGDAGGCACATAGESGAGDVPPGLCLLALALAVYTRRRRPRPRAA